MNPPGKARKRLRLALVAGILLLAAGAGYDIKTSPPIYLESATVELSLPKAQNTPNAYYIYASSLITSGEVMVQTLMSPAAQRRIAAAGRGATVNFALVNLYNEEYPEYGVPLATLTATSPVAGDAHRAFAAATRMIGVLLAAQQRHLGVAPSDRITAQILGDTGPLIQTGSRPRVFGGLAVLTAITLGLAWNGAARWGGPGRYSATPGTVRSGDGTGGFGAQLA